jgi:FdhD protein
VDKIREIDIRRVSGEKFEDARDCVIIEKALKLYINYKFAAALMCMPGEEEELAAGFLFSEGYIASFEDIRSIERKNDNMLCITLAEDMDSEPFRETAVTSGCGGGRMSLDFTRDNRKKSAEGSSFSAKAIMELMKQFNNRSELFRETGGVHSCAVCDSRSILIFSEDIGRHNALDKVIGKALILGMDLTGKLVLTSGRISSDMIMKASRAGISIIVSHSAPTDLTLDIAGASNMTVIGFARGSRMNIYCGGDCILE